MKLLIRERMKRKEIVFSVIMNEEPEDEDEDVHPGWQPKKIDCPFCVSKQWFKYYAKKTDYLKNVGINFI